MLHENMNTVIKSSGERKKKKKKQDKTVRLLTLWRVKTLHFTFHTFPSESGQQN